MTGEEFVPYETLARVEAQDTIDHEPLLRSLDISEQDKWKLEYIMASALASGIEQGFAMSDFAGLDPATALETYVAGYEQAIEDIRELKGD